MASVKLHFTAELFRKNLELMRRESAEQIRKTLGSGASAYVTTAVRMTPPNIGNRSIDPIMYADGLLISLPGDVGRKPYGRRKIYDLRSLVRAPGRLRYKPLYGKLLRQGVLYLVRIRRKNKNKWISCMSLSEAEHYVHEDNRGLMRAAWGLTLASLTGKVPPSISELVIKRPALASYLDMNSVNYDPLAQTVTIINRAIDPDAGFVGALDASASFSAMRTMNDQMTKFFRKKFDL